MMTDAQIGVIISSAFGLGMASIKLVGYAIGKKPSSIEQKEVVIYSIPSAQIEDIVSKIINALKESSGGKAPEFWIMNIGNTVKQILEEHFKGRDYFLKSLIAEALKESFDTIIERLDNIREIDIETIRRKFHDLANQINVMTGEHQLNLAQRKEISTLMYDIREVLRKKR